MRKWLTVLGFCFALAFTDIQGYSHHPDEGSFEIGGGYRTDRVHWSVGFFQTVDSELFNDESDTLPDFSDFSDSSDDSDFSDDSGANSGTVSTLRWRDLRIAEVTATFRYTNCANFYFRGFANAGQIYHGRVEDKDYIDGIRVIEAHATCDKGHVYDLSGGIGYTFRFLCNRVSISPLIGYSYDVQQLRMNNLDVKRDLLDGIIGRIPGLHNSYRTRWKGFWFGVDFRLYMFCHLTLFGSAEYHRTHFRAYGHWNLRTDFVKDFKQHASGHGNLYTLGIRYDIAQYYLAATGIYQGWHTHSGIDKVYLVDRSIESRLRGVFWHSLGFTGTFGVRF